MLHRPIISMPPSFSNPPQIFFKSSSNNLLLYSLCLSVPAYLCSVRSALYVPDLELGISSCLYDVCPEGPHATSPAGLSLSQIGWIVDICDMVTANVY